MQKNLTVCVELRSSEVADANVGWALRAHAVTCSSGIVGSWDSLRGITMIVGANETLLDALSDCVVRHAPSS